jgi:hypothetical protein
VHRSEEMANRAEEVLLWCRCPYKLHTNRPECPVNFRKPFLELIDVWRHRAAMSHTTGDKQYEEAYTRCARELQAALDGNKS